MAITAKLFRVLASARHARAFHPRGLLLTGELTPFDGGELPLPAGPRTVTARLSKGVGTPGDVPDALGLALRLHGEPLWDLTLTSSRPRFLPWPSASWTEARFSSLTPYRTDGEAIWLGARADRRDNPGGASLDSVRRLLEDGPLQYILYTARGTGAWRTAARLTLDRVAADAPAPAFDPVRNHPDGLEMAPKWLAHLRESAYAGSRTGRGGPGPE
ncbi:hypothetical protein [Amycolatopsis magusensis]|uniref:hypothetical protein n=1 Tax=Amycolatopsis magusensis TaxID=882444 RepID=UPI003C2F512B